jgi:hypothetical protein
MLYMLLAVTVASHGGSAMAGMSSMSGGTARFPVLGFGLALCMFGYVVWVVDRIRIAPLTAAGAGVPAAAAAAAGGAGLVPGAGLAAGDGASPLGAGCGPTAPTRLLAPVCAAACKIAMGVTMGYMLITML